MIAKPLPALQASATAAEERAAQLADALAALTDQASDLRARIARYGINDDMLAMAADQNRLGFLERQLAHDQPIAQQAQQVAQRQRDACAKLESEVWALERRLADLLACTASYVLAITVGDWIGLVALTAVRIRMAGVEPQMATAPARPPLPDDVPADAELVAV